MASGMLVQLHRQIHQLPRPHHCILRRTHLHLRLPSQRQTHPSCRLLPEQIRQQAPLRSRVPKILRRQPQQRTLRRSPLRQLALQRVFRALLRLALRQEPRPSRVRHQQPRGRLKQPRPGQTHRSATPHL